MVHNFVSQKFSIKKLSYNWFTPSSAGKKEVVRNATIVACGVMVKIEAFNSDFLVISLATLEGNQS